MLRCHEKTWTCGWASSPLAVSTTVHCMQISLWRKCLTYRRWLIFISQIIHVNIYCFSYYFFLWIKILIEGDVTIEIEIGVGTKWQRNILKKQL